MSAQDRNYAQVIEHPILVTPAPAGTARIGAELREVRERVGWKLSEVAAELRIREPYLEAIEQGDLEALPGPAYQVGFVRAYAQALGLDGEEILRRFRAEGLGAVKKPELSFLAPVPDRAVPSGAIVLLGVVLLLVGYGLWFLHTESDQTLAASVPPVPAQLAPLAVPPALPKPAPAIVQATQTAKPAAPVASTAPATVAGAAASTTTATPPAPVAGATAPATAIATAAVAPAFPAGKTIVATGDDWVEVKDANGNILFSRVMHAGDSWPVPDLPGLTMTAGNAGGTEIANNGAAGQPLGAAGAVMRNYALTPGNAAPANAPPASIAPRPVQNPATGTN